MLNILAHAGEAHETTAEKLAHSLEWYIQIPVFIIAVTIIASLFWLITKKQDKTLLLTSFVLLVAGFVLATFVPVIAILSITLGLATTLLITLIGLTVQR